MSRRSTRATAAVARLNQRAGERSYRLAITGDGLFVLRERDGDGEREISPALDLDDFVRFVDAQGPQLAPRMTKNDLAFARQLQKKKD